MKRKLFFIAGLVVLILIGVAFWFYRVNTFSKEILRLEILGPDQANAGDEITYTVKYKNNGNVVLQNPQLIFVMPDHSLTEDGKTRITKDLKDIYPGDEESVTIKTRLLGNEQDVKVAQASLFYTPKNLTIRYESDASLSTRISQVPINLDFDLPTKVEKGKELQYQVNYFSNIDYPLENLSIKIAPVNGFDFESADPASLDNVEWKLPTLQKAQGGRITLKGKVSVNPGQTMTFSAQLGMWQGGDFIVIKQTTQDVQVIDPLLLISQQVNGSESYVASPGETLHYQVFFTNVGPTPFSHLLVQAKLDTSALDISTFRSEGQFDSQSGIVVWSPVQEGQLQQLNPQQQQEVDFTVKVKSDWQPSSSDVGNSVIDDQVTILNASQKFSVKINSGLIISQSAFFKTSAMTNSGPIPPQAGKNTTYTVVWTIKNYFNDAKSVKVKAVLPQNVTLTGTVVPSNQSSKFSFDSVSRQIVWSPGDISAGTGVSGSPVSLSFQISLNPLASQKGHVAPLIGNAQVSGENQFTNTIISSQDAGIDTSLPDDAPDSGGGIVQ